MNLRLLKYYRIPDPFNPYQRIIVSDDNSITGTLKTVYEFFRKHSSDMPRLFRVLVCEEEVSPSLAASELAVYEKKHNRMQINKFNRLKLHFFLSLAKGFVIGYLLYIAPTVFWYPLEAVFDNVAHGLSDYAKWWIIGIFPVKAMIRNFGTGLQFTLPGLVVNNPIFRRIPFIGRIRQIGIKGRWHEMQELSGLTKLYREFGKSQKSLFVKSVEQTYRNIIRKGGSEELISKFRKVSDLIFKDDFTLDRKLADSLASDFVGLINQAVGASEESPLFPWGEIPKLERMKEDLLFHSVNTAFVFAPLKIITPGDEGPVIESVDNYSQDRVSIQPRIISNALSGQADCLQEFFRDNVIEELQERISSLAVSITKENSGETSEEKRTDRIIRLDALSTCFETLRGRIQNYHLGDNRGIPNEKGTVLSDFYHQMYLIFGRASCDLENRFIKASCGFLPLLSGSAQRKRISRAFNESYRLINRCSRRRISRFKERIISFIGRSWRTGFVTCIALVFLTGSLFSFYTLEDGDFAVESDFVIGFRDKFFSRRVDSTVYGSGFIVPGTKVELHWRLPAPLVNVYKNSLNNPSSYTICCVIGESFSEGYWDKFISGMSGPLGINFEVVQFTITYVPADVETWEGYDPDGKGVKRLIRDTSDIVEEWKTGILSNRDLNSEDLNYIFDTFLRDMSDKGIIEDYIKRSFSQTSFSTHVYYGSPLERLKPGFDIVLGELDRRERDYKNNPVLSDDEKNELLKSIESARKIVSDTLEEMKEQVALEYGELRRHPEQLQEFSKNPWLHVQELRNFETLWAGLQSYILYNYNRERIKEIFIEGDNFVTERDELMNSLLDHLNSDSHLMSLIDVRKIEFEFKVIGMSQLNMLQQKWRDLI